MAALALLVGALATIMVGPAAAEEGVVVAGPKAFETPEALVEAMIDAATKNDDAALKALAGAQQADLIQPGGDPTVAKVRAKFVENTSEFWKLEDNEDGTKTLVIGDSRWPFPVPLMKAANGWIIDMAAGRREILARRIGRNELNAIKICRAYADAQIEYASKDRDGDRVKEYAQRIKSTPGQKDGLFWETGEDGDMSPFGPFVASAEPYLKDRKQTDPVSGYYWRILKYQGHCAPGGSHGYLINGNMIAGFALIGFPSEYRKTGVMTFIVSNHGGVYEKDMGPRTAEFVRGLLSYNPDASWSPVED